MPIPEIKNTISLSENLKPKFPVARVIVALSPFFISKHRFLNSLSLILITNLKIFSSGWEAIDKALENVLSFGLSPTFKNVYCPILKL